MKRLIALAFCMLQCPFAAAAAEPPLFHLAVAGVPAENGKVLDMAFQEVTRDADASTVLITRRSGGSVSSSMFILRGMCGMARARGKPYFVTRQLAGDGNRFSVSFPATAPDPGAGFTLAQCDLMRY